MRDTAYFKNKKVIVVGLARSGLACANLLYDLGARVSITDCKDAELLRTNTALLKSKDIRLELGSHSAAIVKGNELMIISPGVENKAKPVLWAEKFGIPVISEIEFASMLCPADIIAVTGSGGKSTVTTLIGKIIEASGKKAYVCGNIGKPFSQYLQAMNAGDIVSLEVSSFQLERIVKFRPKIALILNFAKNHLDRHKDMQEYLDAKKRIFMNQGEDDYLILNSGDSVVSSLAKEARSKIVFFFGNAELNPNQAAVMAVGAILGINKDLILKVFKEFKGIEHRLEFVAELNGIKFINDSKATLAESTIWALESINGGVVLICGGRHKGVDYSVIKKVAEKKIRKVIVIGEAAQLIEDALTPSFVVEHAISLAEAVDKAFHSAKRGDYVLLSPMCSSFDMFNNYEDRGRVFKKLVMEKAKTKVRA
ncbi:MAG: Mur ligase family protein [Candidatus Omnitrophota bacterium]|jgi:UDP-N-acetylmuramoylalanine--D-glutamate ligase